MTAIELHEVIERAVKRVDKDLSIPHAVEYIRRRWNVNERQWIGITIMSFVAGLVIGIFIWQFL